MSGVVKKRAVHKKKYFITTVDKTLHRSRNSSVMTKKSLQSNNRALAKCLSQQKRENRNLTAEITLYIAERFTLNQRIKRLEDERKISLVGNWNPSQLEKIKTLKTILNDVSSNVLVTAQLINSVVDLFQDVNINSCRTSETERISCTSMEDKQIVSNPLNQLFINSETAANKTQSNDDIFDLELQKPETNDEHKTPINGPKAVFDLSAISEGSEFESRRSSAQSRLSIMNHRQSKSIGKFETARLHRSRGSSIGNEIDLCMTTPRSVETLEKIPRDILEDLSEKEGRRSSQKQCADEIIEADQLSPFVKIIRIDDPIETLRRGTFVVTNSLQTAAWPPDDAFVSTRKSSKSSDKKQLSGGENKLTPPNPAPSTEPLSESNQLTNYEAKDMDLTEVLHVPVEIGEKLDNPKALKTVVVPTKEKNVRSRSKNARQSAVLDDEVPEKGKRERKRTKSSKQTDLEPLVVLEDVKRRATSGRRTATRNSFVFDEDRYDCLNVSPEAIDPHEKFSSWQSRRSSIADGKLSGRSTPMETIEVLNVIQTPKKKQEMKPKKTPKKREVKPKKTPKKTPRVSEEKENFEVNERPRRARKNVDYKLPSLTAKIRRDTDGSVIITERVSDLFGTEADSLSFTD